MEAARGVTLWSESPAVMRLCLAGRLVRRHAYCAVFHVSAANGHWVRLTEQGLSSARCGFARSS